MAYSTVAEHRLAAKAALYTWEQWLDLPGDPWAARGHDCKAAVIAAYRMEEVMEAMANEA